MFYMPNAQRFDGRAVFADTITDKEIIEKEIALWKRSERRRDQLKSREYYSGKHDILARVRSYIDASGSEVLSPLLPNNRIVDNQFRKLVDQKCNYLLGKPLSFATDDDIYSEKLEQIFDSFFHKTLRNIGRDSLLYGIGWAYVYYGGDGELAIMRLDPFDCLPLWADSEHTRLNMFIRVYSQEHYVGKTLEVVEHVEIYKPEHIENYTLTRAGALVEDTENPITQYRTSDTGEGLPWGDVIPIIPFKYGHDEGMLLWRVKTLQDALNTVLSDFQNNLQEDARNTILVLRNYDGQDLAEFRRNLMTYGAVKVRSVDGSDGGVDTLTININADNYKTLSDMLRRSIVENGLGFDAKNDRAGTPNQMNIQSMYSDIDLDANALETEYQSSLWALMVFVDNYLVNKGAGDFAGVDVRFTFNRDMIFNTVETMDMLYKGGLTLSNETLISQVPFVSDVSQELERVESERGAGDIYSQAFASELDTAEAT